MITNTALFKLPDPLSLEKPCPVKPWHKVAYDAYAALLRLRNLPRWIRTN